MMAETFGSRAAAIDESEDGDMYDGAWKERTHESGFMQVRQTKPHPLFEGLSDDMVFLEAHYWEIKSVPELQEVIGRAKVGDKINVSVLRQGTVKEIPVLLKAG